MWRLAAQDSAAPGLQHTAVRGGRSTDLPPDDVVGLDILRPGELAEDHLISFGDDFLFLDVVLTEDAQNIRHLLWLRAADWRGSPCGGWYTAASKIPWSALNFQAVL